VSLFRSTAVTIGNGCCSSVVVSSGLSTTTSPVSLVQQALPSSCDGGVKTVARLWLALVYVVVARWCSDLIVIFITFRIVCSRR
jgi:hypothetical protein